MFALGDWMCIVWVHDNSCTAFFGWFEVWWFLNTSVLAACTFELRFDHAVATCDHQPVFVWSWLSLSPSPRPDWRDHFWWHSQNQKIDRLDCQVFFYQKNSISLFLIHFKWFRLCFLVFPWANSTWVFRPGGLDFEQRQPVTPSQNNYEENIGRCNQLV